MPATIKEAFVSPFGSGSTHYSEQTDTADIHYAPQQLHPPMYNHVPPSHIAKGLESVYAHPSIHPAHPASRMPDAAPIPTSNIHDCDALITKMMACPVCRQKIRAILAAEILSRPEAPVQEQQHVHKSEQGAQSTQRGGGLDLNSLPSWTNNFIVGLVLIFLVDRIFHLR